MLRIVCFFICIISFSVSAEIRQDFIKTLYQPSNVKDIKLSPSGEHAVAIYYEDKHDYIDIYDLDTRKGVNLQYSEFERVKFKEVRWVDNNTVLVYWTNGSNNSIDVYHLAYSDGDISLEKKFDLPLDGTVINHLPTEEDAIIFAKRSSKGGFEDFYKIKVSEEQSHKEITRKKNLLGIKYKNVTDWAFDAQNELRFIEAKKDDEFVYYYLKPNAKKWIETARSNDSELNYFYMLDENERLVTLVKKDGDRRVVAYFDPLTMKQSEIAFEDPIYDIRSPLVNTKNNLIGVSLIKQGATEHVYFDKSLSNIKSIVSDRKGNKRTFIISSNLENNRFLISASNNGFHYKYYDYNLSTDVLKLTKDPLPWLRDIKFSSTKTLKVTKSDGIVIEAYLSLPVGHGENVPLIVNPHGGPFGIRDYKFDKDTEILTAHGFAVLRVNFRGSSGFGKKYIESAKQGFGTIIEEDIFESLNFVLANYSIDKNKICSVGTSYGGYSTAMLLAKHPDIFKCGVSFAGVFDLSLQINESKRFSQYRDGLDKFFKDYIADLEVNPELQKEKSPIYHAEKIKAPLLILHGTDDPVVDLEQSYRMHYALENVGLNSELYIFDNFEHGFRNDSDRIKYFEKVIPFLEEHLK